MPLSEIPTSAGTCAIVGLANVGKSTLLNGVLGHRLVAVSKRPQTTRNQIIGVHNVATDAADVQIVFVDTPGIQTGRGPLRAYMREQALAAAGECDVALLVLDVTERAQRAPDTLLGTDAAAVFERLGPNVPVVLALNKVDRLPDKSTLLPMLEVFHATGRYTELVPVSALNKTGLDDCAAAVARLMPPGPKLFPDDVLTDRPERFLAAELIREQLFRQLGEEVPYATAVAIESWDERPRTNDVVVSAIIYVERDSQKGIVVGKGGDRIRQLGEASRNAISSLLGCPAHVKLLVRVSRNWSRDAIGLRKMGYES